MTGVIGTGYVGVYSVPFIIPFIIFTVAFLFSSFVLASFFNKNLFICFSEFQTAVPSVLLASGTYTSATPKSANDAYEIGISPITFAMMKR